MYESDSDLQRLQSLLYGFYATASAHLLSIHQPSWRMSVEESCATLKNVCVLNLATVTADGAPMVAPVDGLFLRGDFWFGSSHESYRFKHIRRDNRVSAAYTVGEEISIIVHGKAIECDLKSGGFDFLHDYCREIYGPTYDDWGNWGDAPFARIEAERLYAIKIKLNEEDIRG